MEPVTNVKLNLLDIQRFTRVDQFETDLKQVFGFMQRRSDKILLGDFIEENRKIFRNLAEDAYDVIRVYGGIREMKKIKEKYRVEGGIDMCKAWEEMKADERRVGEDRMKDLKKALENKKYRKKLYREYGIE